MSWITNDEKHLKNSDEAKEYPVFGLNTNCYCTKFEYNDNATEDTSESIDIALNIKGSEFRVGKYGHIYGVNRVYDSNGELLTDENSEEYIKTANKRKAEIAAYVIHILKALGVTQTQIDNAFANKTVNDFKNWGCGDFERIISKT